MLIVIGLGFWYLPMMISSSGIPDGSCSVRALLLDASGFPAGTTMSSNEDFEGAALDTVSHTFRNEADGFETYHAVQYYNTPLLAWQKYRYNYAIFKEDKYSGSWIIPNEITSISRTADQYHFACSNNTEFGNRCMMTARYGRYFVFFRSTVTQKFTAKDIALLLQEIDHRMSPCISK
jgi:hypothetical protein